MNGANATLFATHDAALDNFDISYTPDVDYLDGDTFDFENADLGGELIGARPGSGSRDDYQASNGDGQEKRKSPDEGNDSPEGDAKRQEIQEGEKGAKKPGRKPLTTEPTTKRKAQNRAAQRAFRERKEKHLRDLETKVTQLSKAQEADRHENGLLKAQVERLQTQLREYRKRLSLSNGAVRGSPPLNFINAQNRTDNAPSYGVGFRFDFPGFGGLPGSHLFGNQNQISGDRPTNRTAGNTPPVMTQSPTSLRGHRNSLSQVQPPKQNSMGRSMGPQIQGNGSNVTNPTQATNFDTAFAPYSTNNHMHGFAGTLPRMGNDGFEDLFSPSILEGANADEYFGSSQNNAVSIVFGLGDDNGGDSKAGLKRVSQFNSGSTSDSTSPTASSSSQWNANGNSSCGTSPGPSHGSPALKDNKEKPSDTSCDKIKPSRQQKQNSQVPNKGCSAQTGMNSVFGFGNTDLSMPPMNSFDPVLFGNYRDSNEAVVGNGDFSGGFFDDAPNPPFDMGSPSNLFGILQPPQLTHNSLNVNEAPAKATAPSRNLMAEIEKTRDGENDEHVIGARKDADGKYISCNSIWTQLQSNPDFQEGKFDLDGLCSELRAKAKCSESGVIVNQDHVDAVLKRLGQKDDQGKPYEAPRLMFEQDSWDNAMKKLQNGSTA